ncbi:G5 domain-containing protein [Georgenia sp. TF02-10]|uniref:aggregation-promoting factor C-terminal-like domain-containing protein n=1 Tax=Georgenia sp. TF02-10 TaxID=2917725 RepID=UPI001FA72F57|nr:G5 domain-containing protein [Georgenia sp. TF02-10]UNX55544.1 G5 domain-containing protein [Georgenia sp. TF02-10]
MARHTAARTAVPAARPAGDPAPGSRRALRQQAQGAPAAAPHRALPRGVVRTVRVGVLGAVVAGTGAFTLTQAGGPGTEPALAAVESGTLALRAGETASRSQLAGRQALEADGARTFALVVDGQTRDVTTTAASLGEALAEAGVRLAADDVVSAPLAEPVPAGETVQVGRGAVEHVTEETVEKFTTVEQPDATLPAGERQVVTAGVDGVTTDTYEVRTVDGKEVSRTLLTSVMASAKVDEVVRVGTKEPEPAQAPAAASAAGAAGDGAAAAGPTAQAASGDVRAIGAELAAARGWGADQFQCLDRLWTKESNWDHRAENASSGAYGIPQALPGSKMGTVAADWRTNPVTQITWGLNYIAGRYGTPCGAWGHSQSHNWY